MNEIYFKIEIKEDKNEILEQMFVVSLKIF